MKTSFSARSFDLPPVSCPSCGEVLDAATLVQGDGSGVEVGALTVCLRCTSILQFTDGFGLRLVDIETLDPPPDAKTRQLLHIAQKIIREMKAAN